MQTSDRAGNASKAFCSGVAAPSVAAAILGDCADPRLHRLELGSLARRRERLRGRVRYVLECAPDANAERASSGAGSENAIFDVIEARRYGRKLLQPRNASKLKQARGRQRSPKLPGVAERDVAVYSSYEATIEASCRAFTY